MPRRPVRRPCEGNAGSPYDGHTLAPIIPAIEASTGTPLQRILVDRGYKGHNASESYRFKIFIQGQKRRVTEAIKHQLGRGSTVEPVIGHLKNEHRMTRNHLAGSHGDAANAVLAAVGYNFRILLKWLALLRALSLIWLASSNPFPRSHQHA